jgi:sulfur carrier protein ThiS
MTPHDVQDREAPAPESGFPIGHNSAACVLKVEVRLFNSLACYDGNGGHGHHMEMEAGSTVGDILRRLGIPPGEVFLVLVNGRDITPQLNGGLRLGFAVDEGDVVALSGPVPYSWGYGAPVV